MKKICILLLFFFVYFDWAFVNCDSESNITFANNEANDVKSETSLETLSDTSMELPKVISLPGEEDLNKENKILKPRQKKGKLRPKILEDSPVKTPADVSENEEDDEDWDDEEIAKEIDKLTDKNNQYNQPIYPPSDSAIEKQKPSSIIFSTGSNPEENNGSNQPKLNEKVEEAPNVPTNVIDQGFNLEENEQTNKEQTSEDAQKTSTLAGQKVIDQGFNVDESYLNQENSNVQATNQEQAAEDALKEDKANDQDKIKGSSEEESFPEDGEEDLTGENSSEDETNKSNAANQHEQQAVQDAPKENGNQKILDEGFNVDESSSPTDQGNDSQQTSEDAQKTSTSNGEKVIDQGFNVDESPSLYDQSSNSQETDQGQTAQDVPKENTPVNNQKVIDQGFNVDENSFNQESGNAQATNQEQAVSDVLKEDKANDQDKIKGSSEEENFPEDGEEDLTGENPSEEKEGLKQTDQDQTIQDPPKENTPISDQKVIDQGFNVDESHSPDDQSNNSQETNQDQTVQDVPVPKENTPVNDQKVIDQGFNVNENSFNQESGNAQATNQEQTAEDASNEDKVKDSSEHKSSEDEGENYEEDVKLSTSEQDINKEAPNENVIQPESPDQIDGISLNEFYTTYSPPKLVGYSPSNFVHKNGYTFMNIKPQNVYDTKIDQNKNYNYIDEANKLSNKIGFQNEPDLYDDYGLDNPANEAHGSTNEETYHHESNYLQYPSVYKLFKDKLNLQNQIQASELKPQVKPQNGALPLPITAIENNPSINNPAVAIANDILIPSAPNTRPTNKIVNNSPKIVFTKPSKFSFPSIDLFRRNCAIKINGFSALGICRPTCSPKEIGLQVKMKESCTSYQLACNNPFELCCVPNLSEIDTCNIDLFKANDILTRVESSLNMPQSSLIKLSHLQPSFLESIINYRPVYQLQSYNNIQRPSILHTKKNTTDNLINPNINYPKRLELKSLKDFHYHDNDLIHLTLDKSSTEFRSVPNQPLRINPYEFKFSRILRRKVDNPRPKSFFKLRNPN